MVQNETSSTWNMDTPKPQDSTTVVLDKKKAPPLEGWNYTKMVECEIKNMGSTNQSSMKYSSMHN